MDTIFALATAAGKAGVSIIRISGPGSLDLAKSLGANLRPHDRKLVRLIDRNNVLLDEAFALSFEPGKSFTDEQVVELHTHGSPAIVGSVLSELSFLGGRIADPGEFTRRAMENGKLDLAEVEGLADLIEAETEAQRLQAIRVFQGALGELSGSWRDKLIRAAALLEATIDFVDEDVPVDVLPEVRDLLSIVFKEVTKEADGVGVRERLKEGFEVALIGPPNAGKSTLLNRLAGRDAAITSDIPGTTRDIIEVKMELGGMPVTILDTAGLRTSEDVLETLGIEKGIRRATAADIRVHLSAESEFDRSFEGRGLDIYLTSKADLRTPLNGTSISAVSGFGVDELLERIEEHLKSLVSNAGIATRRRHEDSLRKTAEALKGVISNLDTGIVPVDLLAEDIRFGIRALDSLIGHVDVENVLDHIFSSFCIGK